MKRFLLLIIIFIGAFVASEARSYTVSEVPNVHVEDRTAYVSNPDGILSPATVDSLNLCIGRVWQLASVEMVVVAIDDIEGYDINEFATKLFEAWGIGKKDRDNGLLMLVVKDARQAVIRTGRGLEGVLPDVICGRVLRGAMFPEFRQGDYDAGVMNGVKTLAAIVENPEARDEVLSAYANDAASDEAEFTTADALNIMFWIGIVSTAILLILYISAVHEGKNLTLPERYEKINSLRPYALFACFLGMGIPIIAFIVVAVKLHRMRSRHAVCANCGHKMHKLSEEADNAYLTPAEDAEERLNSVDYDVWLCPECGTTDIIPFVNRSAAYTVCHNCGARADAVVSNQVVLQPTTSRKGMGVKRYACRNCHHVHDVSYEIPKLVAPIVIVGGGGGGNGFGGGGMSGGSFGGGMTMGGGASGSW